MKKFLLVLFLGLFIYKIGHAQEVYAPVGVSNSNTKRVFVHVMPWFETKTSIQSVLLSIFIKRLPKQNKTLPS